MVLTYLVHHTHILSTMLTAHNRQQGWRVINGNKGNGDSNGNNMGNGFGNKAGKQ
jgi:hypothetical protein